MQQPCGGIAVLALLVAGAAGAAAQEPVRHAPPADEGTKALVQGTVRRVLGGRLFTVEWSDPGQPELIVSAPDAEATPIAGTTVVVHGVMSSFDEADLEDLAGWGDVDPDARGALAGAPVLHATSVTTSAGRQLIAGSPLSAGGLFVAPSVQAPRQVSRSVSREPLEARVRPGALSELIDELGGRYVTMPAARVVAVLNPRVLLVEPANPLPAMKGNLDRILVMIQQGELHVTPTLLVGSDVKVGGVARTLLGVQVTREVPWPTDLTPQLIKRLEVRAVVLASSVQTPDGVDLIERPSSVD